MPSGKVDFQCPTCGHTSESWKIIETHEDGPALEQTFEGLSCGAWAQLRIHASDDGQGIAMTLAKLEMP